jgi:hypothetical protein
MPSDRRRKRRQLIQPGDIDVNRHRDAVGGHRRFPDATCRFGRADFVRPATRLEGGARQTRSRTSSPPNASTSALRRAAGIDAEPYDHGTPRARASIAT